MRVFFGLCLMRLGVCVVLMASATGQQTARPDLELQREAMKKLAFLVGKWWGGARWFRIGDTLELSYAEDVQYEQDGVVLRMDGRGRRKSDGLLVIGGTHLISYDVPSGTYRIRLGHNKHEGALKIDEDWKGMMIDFATPPQRTTRAMLRVNEEGYWTDMHWVTEGSNPPWMFLRVVVRRQNNPPARKINPPSQSGEPQEKTERF